MTDKEYEHQKKRIGKLRKKWHHALWLSWWRIDYDYERGYKIDSDSKEVINCVAECSTNWQYRTAIMTFYLPSVKNQSDEELENQFVHECSHILIGAIQDFSDDTQRELTEYATETVARALIWAREAGQKDKK